jgi:hypothetical protein
MAEIHAPVIAADINDDGKIEIVTTDAHGNVAAWTADGEEIWEVHLKSLIPQASFAHLLLKFVDGLLCNLLVLSLWQHNIYLMAMCWLQCCMTWGMFLSLAESNTYI